MGVWNIWELFILSLSFFYKTNLKLKAHFFGLSFIYLFFLLYNIVLVLPYIDMNPPRGYMCSSFWTPLSILPPHPISLGKSHFKKSVNFMSKDIATNVTGLPRAKKWDNLKVEMTGWQSSGCILNIQKPIGSWWKI